jgi:tetratricopeptide (TPR) repeat protein
MKSKLALFTSIVFLSAAAFAQSAQITIVPEVKGSANAQLNLAETLRQEIYRASDPDARAYAVARTISHLEVIPLRWPNDRNALAHAYLLQADVFIDGGWIPNVPPVIAKALEVIDPQRSALAYQRLGEALDRLNDREGARSAFANATSRPHLVRLNELETATVLRAAGLFYGRAGDWTLAADAYAEAAAGAQSAFQAAHDRLFAARAWHRAGDRGRAAEQAAMARATVFRARGEKGRSSQEHRLLDSIEHELAVIERP